MNKEINIAETISELDRISDLCDSYVSLRDSRDNITPEKNAEKDAIIEEVNKELTTFEERQIEKSLPKRPKISKACLIAPPSRPWNPRINTPKLSILIGVVSGFSVGFFGILSVIALISPPINNNFLVTLETFVILLFIISAIVWFFKGSQTITTLVDYQKKLKELEEKQQRWENWFNEGASKKERERFFEEFSDYENGFKNHIAICNEQYEKGLARCHTGFVDLEVKYASKLDDINSKLIDVVDQLNAVTLIHSDLLFNAHRISSMLKTGRADTLKEAINLTLDEERKDNEEAERRAEARQRQAVLERQARDNRLHNEAMERAAEEEAKATRAHNEAMERAARAQAEAAQAQAREAARQSELAERQAREARNASSSRCFGCVNYSKCSESAKKNSINCGGYRPR